MTGETVTNAVARRDTGPGAMIKQYSDDFQMVLPEHVKPATFVRLAQGVLRRDAKLAQLAQRNPASLMAALLECARLGHDPGTTAFWLVPYGSEIQGIEGYTGIIERIFRAGAVSSVKAELVYAKDHYRFNPTTMAVPDFQPDDFADDRGELIGAFAYAELKDGGTSRVVRINRKYIDKVKAESKGSNSPSSPWTKWFDQMVLKGLALDTPIATPTGWTTMGNVQVGDTVFDMHGQQTPVIATSEVKNLDCYRITFACGEQIVCDAEHRWLATIGINGPRRRRQHGWDVHGVAELYAAKQAGKPIVVPVAGALDLDDADLPIDPWVLGYWLGNGKKSAASVTCHVDHQDQVVAGIASAGYQVGSIRKDARSKAVAIGIRGGITKRLANAGLLGHKHIPDIYLRASYRQRLALLRGLVDSDGTLGNDRGRAIFYSTEPHLVQSAAELARSLGETVNVGSVETHGYGKDVTSHQVGWQPSVAPVTVAAKLKNYRPRQVASYRTIKSIERTLTVPTRCIAVDSPTHTFLAGESMIPTHNTVLRRLEPFVPTSTEFRREELRAVQAVAAEAGQPTQRPASPPRQDREPVNVTHFPEANDEPIDAEVIDRSDELIEMESN